MGGEGTRSCHRLDRPGIGAIPPERRTPRFPPFLEPAMMRMAMIPSAPFRIDAAGPTPCSAADIERRTVGAPSHGRRSTVRPGRPLRRRSGSSRSVRSATECCGCASSRSTTTRSRSARVSASCWRRASTWSPWCAANGAGDLVVPDRVEFRRSCAGPSSFGSSSRSGCCITSRICPIGGGSTRSRREHATPANGAPLCDSSAMVSGWVLVAAWAEFALLLAVLGYFVLRGPAGR